MVRPEVSRETHTENALLKKDKMSEREREREYDFFAYTWPIQAWLDVSFGLQLQL